MSKIKTNDLMGDKFIEFMESQGIGFVDVTTIAGHARKEIESKTGKRVVSRKRFIPKRNKKLLDNK